MEKHQLFRKKKEELKIPEDWGSGKDLTPLERMIQEKADLEQKIKEIEDILFPGDENVVVVPKGVDPESFERDLEKNHQILINRYKEINTRISMGIDVMPPQSGY